MLDRPDGEPRQAGQGTAGGEQRHMAGKQRGSRSIRIRSARWLAAVLAVSFLLAAVSAWDMRARLATAPNLAAALAYCADVPFWAPEGYACLRLTSPLFLLGDWWAAFLLPVSAPLVALRSYRLAQAGARPSLPWLWRDVTGFWLGLLPWAAAVLLLAERVAWPLLLLPAGAGGSWWLTGWLARRRLRQPVTVAAAAPPPGGADGRASGPAPPRPPPAAAGRSSPCRALVPVPFAPVLRTIPIPPGPLLIKDADGPLPPLWERLLGDGSERGLGEAKELHLSYGFQLAYPVTVVEYLLACWHGAVDSVAQGGATRSHHPREVTGAHLQRLLLTWPLYWLARRRLDRALRPYYRAGAGVQRRQAWSFADAALLEFLYRRQQALRATERRHPWLREPVVNVTLTNARRYCYWLSAETGRRCRLPTELEFLRAAYYLERERGWQLLPVFGRNWYWTADWYAELPSYAGRTIRRYPFRTTRYPWHTLKSVHIDLYERAGAESGMRAANHGLLYVCGPPPAGSREEKPDGAAGRAGAERAGAAGTVF